ncbi:MAG: DUF2827 family protein, partial [Burkholderiales bacterium]
MRRLEGLRVAISIGEFSSVTKAMLLLQRREFVSVVKYLELVRQRKFYFEDRFMSARFLAHHSDVVLTHEWENGLNNLYVDYMYDNYPLVHNSPSRCCMACAWTTPRTWRPMSILCLACATVWPSMRAIRNSSHDECTHEPCSDYPLGADRLPNERP